MKLHEVIKVTSKPKKRLGRGIGSGRGKTAGRGTKGQKARGKIPLRFAGGLSLYKKLPLRRGLGNPKRSPRYHLITLSDLNSFKNKEVVGIDELIKSKIVSSKEAKKGVKVLGVGEIKTSLTVRLPVSKSAQEKIEKKGGKIEYA
ncbi:50S ribosomal protein L15 [Candidatus Daviesbacteria bacterium]|nr:50S ribosomal protein L15 [Candidatus Daviesbacteria bacterium]